MDGLWRGEIKVWKFGAFCCTKNHIGFYPAPSGIEAFKDELSEYKSSNIFTKNKEEN